MRRATRTHRAFTILVISWQAENLRGLNSIPPLLYRGRGAGSNRLFLPLRSAAQDISRSPESSECYHGHLEVNSYDEVDEFGPSQPRGVDSDNKTSSVDNFTANITAIDDTSASSISNATDIATAKSVPKLHQNATTLKGESAFSDYNLWRISSRYATLRSAALILILTVGIFSAAYALFPGSFVYHENSGQYLNSAERISNGNADSMLDYPEYSESGGVAFFEDDVPMAKTTVLVH